MRNQTKLQVVSNLAGTPTQVRLNQHKLKVMKVLQFWRTNNPWWRTGVISEKKCWRLLAASPQTSIVMEICYDETAQEWNLVRKLVK